MIVLSEDSPRLDPSPSAHSVKAVTEAARIADCRVCYIPQEEVCDSAADALSYVPVQTEETPGVWIGCIPTPEWSDRSRRLDRHRNRGRSILRDKSGPLTFAMACHRQHSGIAACPQGEVCSGQ